MRFVPFLSSLLVIGSAFGSGIDTKFTQEEYVAKWSNAAVFQMKSHKIPASITLAQGILESGNGNSILALIANNHFGIKCHEWEGDMVYMDDDQAQECFRKYPQVEDSYDDHSLFLTSRSRYASLFLLPSDDYAGWAEGLKTAGYATNPKYAKQLIEVIERLKLNQFDEPSSKTATMGSELLAQELKASKQPAEKSGNKKSVNTESIESLETVSSYYQKHSVKEHKNKIDYIVARKGDTFYKLSKEFKIGMWQLYKYNDFGAKKDMLAEGDIVYLEPKRKKSKEKGAVYVPNRNTTLVDISQTEGIKLSALMKLNEVVSSEQIVAKGQKVLLR